MVLSFCRGPGSIHALKRRGFRGLKVLSTENEVMSLARAHGQSKKGVN